MIAFVDQDNALKIIKLALEHLADWPMRSAEAFRNAILGDGMLAINPLLDISADKDVEFLREVLRRTVAEGRMIDFGFIPNEIIKTESLRSRLMFESNEFQHPYPTWLATTSWEGGFNGYFISAPGDPLDPATPMGWKWKGATLVVELYGVSIPGVGDVVILYDMVSIKVYGPDQTRVSPATMRVPPGLDTSELTLAGRGANSLDPLVTMLRLLADASIQIVDKPAPEKLNKARARQGKHPIPGYTVVATKDYVAEFNQSHRTASRIDRGGHHASPVPHWRRAHHRHLADGRVVTVKSSKVNWRDSDELHRMFYRIHPEGGKA